MCEVCDDEEQRVAVATRVHESASRRDGLCAEGYGRCYPKILRVFWLLCAISGDTTRLLRLVYHRSWEVRRSGRILVDRRVWKEAESRKHFSHHLLA
jgi:hypothetical protein